MKTRFTLVALILCLFLCAGSASANLITNGGFETGDLSGWFAINGGVVTHPVHSGNYAAALSLS